MSGQHHTPGPWLAFIDDSGDRWTGWPLSICAASDEDKVVVRTGGQWPYEWNAAVSQREAVANAHLIAAAPNLLEAANQARLALAGMVSAQSAIDMQDDVLGRIGGDA